MDAAITNNGSTRIYIPGPDIEIAAGETKVLNDITLSDIDGNAVIKSGVVAGTLSVSVTPDSQDAAKISQSGRLGVVDPVSLLTYTVATLPATGNYEGRVAYATNGRKVGEGPGAGTGVPVYWSNTAWRVFSGDTAVAA